MGRTITVRTDQVQTALCDNTITELGIDIDVELLQNLVILRYYCYCKILILMIDIDTGIA